MESVEAHIMEVHELARNKQKYVSYRCSKRKKIENPCKCKEINRSILDEFVINQLFNTLLNPHNLQPLFKQINQKVKQKYSDMDRDLPQLQKRLNEVNQKVSNLVQAIAMSGLGSLDTITQEIQRLEQEKIELTKLIQDNQVKKESITLTEEQLNQVLTEAREFVLKNNDDMMKYILSRFIHKIIVNNEAIEVQYNLGGFFVEFKRMVLIKSVSYSKTKIYSDTPLKEVV